MSLAESTHDPEFVDFGQALVCQFGAHDKSRRVALTHYGDYQNEIYLNGFRQAAEVARQL